MIQRLFQTILLCVALAGCATTAGPISSPEYPALVAAALPIEAGEVVKFSIGNWIDNANGFSPGVAPYTFHVQNSVVIVAAKKAIAVESWNDGGKFTVIKLIRFQDMAKVRVDSFGLSKRLVIETADPSYNSFEFTKAAGNLIDGAKADEFSAYLNAQIEKPAS
jgi:hypothetical protein